MKIFSPFLPFFIPALFFTLYSTTCPAATYRHQSLHDVYLVNTEHELHVYRIYGKKPGKTIMIIGGIQGDEPGGYLTADLYADISLKQGNLIVVPRANFYSILLKQRDGATGDMNRKFAANDKTKMNMEQEIVSILKELIGQADCLINLHEGSGFFNSEWVSDQENPDRFGQSIIFDARQYFGEKIQQELNLEVLANKVIEKVNPQIENPRYHFKANNHDTVSNDTKHFEQRKSATYYALTQENIPAFGVETSKSIRSNATKVSMQKLVINAFMDEFGIIPETPGVHAEKTKLAYVLIKVNGTFPYAVPNGSKLVVNSGDEVIITDIIANTNRGLAADFLGMGSHNDIQLPFRIAESTKIIIRKDAETCGWVEIITTADDPAAGISQKIVIASTIPATTDTASTKTDLNELQAEKLLLNINGELITIAPNEEVLVPKDKAFIIKGVHTNISRLNSEIFANLKGFAPPKAQNDGNDINYPVYAGQDLWRRYSEDKKGIRYPINVTYNDKIIGKFWIRIIQ